MIEVCGTLLNSLSICRFFHFTLNNFVWAFMKPIIDFVGHLHNTYLFVPIEVLNSRILFTSQNHPLSWCPCWTWRTWWLVKPMCKDRWLLLGMLPHVLFPITRTIIKKWRTEIYADTAYSSSHRCESQVKSLLTPGSH